MKTITNKDEYKDKSEEITINCEVQIPSMLKTQIMLDKKYIGESISSTNMTLKITKNNKLVHKRKNTQSNQKDE